MSGTRRESRQLFPLDWGAYTLLDGVIYGDSTGVPGRNDLVRLTSVGGADELATREIPRADYHITWVNPVAVLVGEPVLVMDVNDDGSVTVGFGRLPHRWPKHRHLGRMGEPERSGGGYWVATAELSELSDIDDGIPDEWRPFLPLDGPEA